MCKVKCVPILRGGNDIVLFANRDAGNLQNHKMLTLTCMVHYQGETSHASKSCTRNQTRNTLEGESAHLKFVACQPRSRGKLLQVPCNHAQVP